MLASAASMGERISTSPAAVWFRDQLWLAYGALDGSLVLRSINVRLGAGATNRFPTTFAVSETVSLAAWGDRLYVLFGRAGEGYQLTSTQDGVTFALPGFVPMNGATETAGFTAYAGGLAVVWQELAGGGAHLLKSTDSGASFTDFSLPFSVGTAGITADPSGDELLIAYGHRQVVGGTGKLTIAVIGTGEPPAILRSVDVETHGRPSRLGLCVTRYHNQPGLHVAVLEGTNGSPYHGRTVPINLDSVGGRELFFGRVIGEPSITFDGTRTWVAWRANGGSDVDQLFVAPHSTVFDLPEELKAFLGQPCDERACSVDPRLVCAATDEQHWQQVPAAIHNAHRGDVVLTPGDGAGIVGTLLDKLEPRQHYDHMGIMVRDSDLVRHATMAHGRLNRRDPGRYMSGEFFGDKAPVDGFRWDVLTYGWPGTITQSVEDAFYNGFNTINPATGRPYNRQGDFLALNPSVARLPMPAEGAPAAEWEAWRRQQRFADPEYPGDEPFGITNLPNGPAYRIDTGQIIEPLVLKPPPVMEATDPRIRAVLHRIADAAERLDGHYRFFAYTGASVALDPAKFGPPVGDPVWSGKPTGAAWSAGTRPVVCSSFVWAAVQLAKSDDRLIEVEGEATESPHELIASPPVDGLYRYTIDERKAAAHALHALLLEKVENEVYLTLQEKEHEKRLEIDLGRIGFAALMTLLAGPVAAAAAFLGVTPSTITSLKLLLEDMPDDVATQMCNTFAADRANETDEHVWESPGEGLAVSPDDIMNFWDAPDPGSSVRSWHGLYRHTEKLMLTPKRYETRRVHRYDRSPGPAHVRGRVIYQGEPIVGARVRFGCDATMTSRLDDTPMFRMDLSAGRYEAVATAYWPSSQELLTGRRVVEVQPGDQEDLTDIELEDPPEWRRLIRCTGRIDLVRKVLIGTDDWAHSGINAQTTMVKAPDTFGPPPGATIATWSVPFFSGFAQRFNVRVDVEVRLEDDLSVVVLARSALCEHYYKHGRPPTGDEIVTTGQHVPVTVPPGGSATLKFDHNSGNVPPDRAHVEFKVENLRAPA